MYQWIAAGSGRRANDDMMTLKSESELRPGEAGGIGTGRVSNLCLISATSNEGFA